MILKYICFLFLLYSCSQKEETKVHEPVNHENETIHQKPKRMLIKKGLIGKGDSFHKITQNFIPYTTIQSIYDKSIDIYHLRRIREGHEYRIYNKAGQFNRFEYDIDSKGYYRVTLNDSINIEVVLYQFDKDTVFTSIAVESMLYESVSELGIDELLAIKLSEVFAWDIDFTYSIQNNDKFNVFYEKLYLDGEFRGIGKIISSNYVTNNDTLHLYNYPLNGNDEYFDENGNNIKKAFLKAPVEYSRISSRFSYKRFHPVLKRFKSHYGTDYAADKNTPVFAIADGRIAYSGFKKYNGNYVHIKHNGGFESIYLHFNSIPKTIRKNSKVKQGDVIGYIGKTGLATGYHVCFRFYQNGVPYNFSNVKNPISSKIDDDEFNEYQSHLNKFKFEL